MLRYRFIIVAALAFLVLNSIVLAADITYGKWHMARVNEGVLFANRSDMNELSSRGIEFLQPAPAPCEIDSNNCWVMAMTSPKLPVYKQPYALFVREYGYTFIESTREGGTEHLRWGWKMTVENKSKNDVLAHASCMLNDKNDFLLTGYSNRDVVGTIIWKGEKATLQDDTVWSFSKNTKPYPPGRVSSIRCYLLLKHIE
jgi:hypothetical protein